MIDPVSKSVNEPLRQVLDTRERGGREREKEKRVAAVNSRERYRLENAKESLCQARGGLSEVTVRLGAV